MEGLYHPDIYICTYLWRVYIILLIPSSLERLMDSNLSTVALVMPPTFVLDVPPASRSMCAIVE
jgi:hypothetical protein